MRSRAALIPFLFFLGAGTLFAGYYGFIPLPFEPSAEKEAMSPAAPQSSAEAIDPLHGIKPTPNGRLTESGVTVDIARVSPDGASVFAGRSKPNTYVTVFDDGKPVGAVKADEGGEWSLATEHKFASTDPKLTYDMSGVPPAIAADDTPGKEVAAAARSTSEASERGTKRAAAAVAAGPEAITKELLRKFEGVVAEAREEAKHEKEQATPSAAPEADATPTVDVPSPGGQPVAPAAQAPTETPSRNVAVSSAPATTPPASTTSSAAATPSPAAPSAPSSVPAASRLAASDDAPRTAPPASAATVETKAGSAASIPVPIMFAYNEATFTDDGRRAADLLLEYLTLKHAGAITLSGHADERGTDDYNMDLSRERLEAVERYLHAGGFTGNLNLVPKGKSEPYMGIDRTKYPREALFQLDRRVELRVLR